MKSIIDNYINSEIISNGLLLADMPTGYGKTYTAARSIYDWVTKGKEEGKVFFITTLIKNLPIEDLKKAYKDAGNSKGYDKDVLVIKSNFDFVKDKILNVNIPQKFKSDAYYDLSNRINLYNQLELKKDSTSKLFKESIGQEIREKLEKNFRMEIQNIIKKELPKGATERRNKIRNNKNYQWIGELYPTVFMNDYKVFLLTVDKFLVKNTTIIEPSYDFIQNAITDNAVIFIDEFDATKETMQNAIIKRAIDSQNDYIKLFKQIYRALQSHEFPVSLKKPYEEYLNEKPEKYTFNTLLDEASELYETYNLRYSYKTVSESIDRKQSFLFNDNSYHTMLRNKCNHIRVTPNEKDRQVKIYFENKNDYDKNRSSNDIIVYGLVRGINSFLQKLKIFIFNWANKYSLSINRMRENDDDEFTVENAMRTIYRELDLSTSQIQLLMENLCIDKKENKKKLIADFSFYNVGFKYFEFVDNDDHLSQTIFNYVQIQDTPEKILLYLSKKSKVIGMSATATLDSVVGNYDINYLKKELNGNFFLVSDDVYEKIKEKLNVIWEPYHRGDVKVEVKILDYNRDNLLLGERLIEILGDRDYVNKYYNKISVLVGENSYVWKRYCNIMLAFKEFIQHDDIMSFFCLNMVLPESGKNNFDLDLLKELFDDIIKINNCNSLLSAQESLYILKSHNFDEEKEEVLEKLSNGEKIFIMSSYKTIGAGQNLQYKIPQGGKFVQIYKPENNADSRVKFKDMDAIFLGDITNLAVNTYNCEKFEKSNMLKYFFQIEYLYQNDEINYSTLNELIKLGFKTYAKSNDCYQTASNKIKEAKSIRKQVTRDVVQAVGRMGRTYVKNSTIYLYTVEKLMDKFDADCLKGKLLSPEMQKLVEVKNNFGYKYTDEEETILNKAERVSSSGKNFIMRMLSRNWNDESMQIWKELRNIVLKYPTAGENEYTSNEIISKLYITSGSESKSYLFAQKGDFSDVIIDFYNDKLVFQNSKRCKDRNVSEVSEEDSRLKQILIYKGMKKFFLSNGWTINFKSDKYILSPILFQNIYKGALGEVAGKFILRQELGLDLNEIETADKFEFFDFEISAGVYIDFKHWKQNYRENDRIDKKAEIMRKLEEIEGKRVYIINILADEGFADHKQNDGRIIEIPCLLNSNGTVNINALNLLKGEVNNDNK